MPSTFRPDIRPRARLPAMLIGLIIGIGAVATLNIVVNPYGAWSTSLVDPVFRSTSWRSARISAPYRARLERPQTLLVGNSRVLEGIPIPPGVRDGFSNLAMAGATMDELAALLALAVKPGSPRRIVWAVDFTAFSNHYRGFDALTARRVSGDRWLHARETVLSFDALAASWDTVWRAVRGGNALPADEQRAVPWSAEVVAAALEDARDATLPPLDSPTRAQIAQWLEFYRGYVLSPERVALFGHTVQTIQATGIELYAFLPPLSLYELEIIRQGGAWPTFLQWKREVATITPVWDFSGYLAPSSAYPRLFDTPYFCHFRAPLGHLILRHALGESCAACGSIAAQITEASTLVDGATIAAYLEVQDVARKRFLLTDSPYTKQVRAVWTQTVAPTGRAPDA